MKQSFKLFLLTAVAAWSATPMAGQSQLYPHHFDLQQVTLLDGPQKRAMDLNIEVLMRYDVDRMLTPFVRQAGLSTGRYEGWISRHPIVPNWGGEGFDLSGHLGGHYLSALALAYAASHDATQRSLMKQRMDYMLGVLRDCQQAYASDKEGMCGFIGGQPINDVWRAMSRGDIGPFRKVRGWVPFYCQHKVLAGLRDAYLYGGSREALDMFRQLADWSVNLIGRLDDATMQQVLDTEHGGMNESLADAYTLLGDKRYLDAARRYSHRVMVEGMQTPLPTFLDNRHANTQVPKYIGFERIGEDDGMAAEYIRAAENFWQDVALSRTTCIGGNSVGEHFLSVANSHRYIDHPDGPESCNTNNMLKLSEMLADRTHDARYADFYEYALWNHILSTQDPDTGGYVYFTTLRPQGYRIYSRPNEGQWCCVGTGMENHSKYGHFVYTHDADSAVYVNLFTPSRLDDKRFALTQRTGFPYEPRTEITLDRGGRFTLALRHPQWVGRGYRVTINGQPQPINVEQGKASYVRLTRRWRKGDRVCIELPMELRMSECPNYADYVALEYGPVLLAAQTTARSQADADTTGLALEQLKGEYAGAGRMDHAPGAVGKSLSLTSAPMLIGERKDIYNKVKPLDMARLRFGIDVSRPDDTTYRWSRLTLRPFYEIHHARYQCYWYQQTAEGLAQSDMVRREQALRRMEARTLDFVATGEQQSEAGHSYSYSDNSTAGSYQDEAYRDVKPGGYIQYVLSLPDEAQVQDGRLAVVCRFTTADAGRRATLTVDGQILADITIPREVEGSVAGFYDVEYPLPASLLRDASGGARREFAVRLTASAHTMSPGWYYLRLVRAQ